MMKNVVHCAERDVSGLSEAGKQCDTQWVRKVRRRLSRIASFVNNKFVKEISMCTAPTSAEVALYVG